MNATRRWLYLLIVAVVVMWVAGVWLTYTLLTSRHVGGNDFYSRWVGGCALLCEGLNPYSEVVTLRIQKGMYGRLAHPDEDQVAFAYPLHSLLFFWPLCFTDNYPLVQAIWFWVLLAALVAAMVLWMQVIRWRPRLWLWVLTMFWSVALYHSLQALLLGQFAMFVLLALVATLWAMQRGHDGWAGLFLALSTVKPQMVYLALPWILLWAAGQRRWRLWWSFGAFLALLTLASIVLLPSWIPDFVRQAIAYPSYTVHGSLTWMVVQYLLGLGRAVEVGTMVLLAVAALLLGWLWWGGAGTFVMLLLGEFVRFSLREWYITPLALWGSVFGAGLLAGWADVPRMRRLFVVVCMVLGLLAGGQAWRDLSQRGRYWLQPDQLAAARWIATNVPEGDVVGSWTAGIYGYFAQRRVVNLDGVVNWDAIHAYRARDLHAYISQQRIGWIVDFDEFVADFTNFYGADPASFLIPVQTFEDAQAPFGRLVVYKIEQ